MLSQVVILVGGLGTRLGALTAKVPKPMLPIGETPFLDILIRNFVRFGFKKVLLLAQHNAEMIELHYADHPYEGVSIRVFDEVEPAGTGGALREARPFLDEVFLLANGDSLFDFNYLALYEIFAKRQASAVLSLARVEDASRYGSVTLDDAGRLVGYAEKSGQKGVPGLISGGVYIVSRDALLGIGPGLVSLETDILPGLVEAGKVYGGCFDGYFIDIGLPESYARAQSEIPAWQSRKVVFFDRDGTLNRDDGYTHRIEDLEFLPGVPEAIRRCNDAGRLVIVITNQAGIARGYFDHVAVKQFHGEMNRRLRDRGAHIDAFYFCPHHPDGSLPELSIHCGCRKPGAGLFRQAAADWKFDLEGAVMIGDKDTDVAAARAFGIDAVLTDGTDIPQIIEKLGI